jgi:hypothetical protein
MKRFPLNLQYNQGIPINAHPGAFGAARKHNFHEGVDLYGKEGMSVYAINDGVVVTNEPFTGPAVGHDWWLPTDAVTVKSDTEYFVYGELKSHLKPGDEVRSGQIIGSLVPVLPPSKIRSYIPKHSNVMLHLEKWNFKYDVQKGWKPWLTREDRPEWLEDPTNDLITILLHNYRRLELLTV